jgi:hypothetical protein
MAQVRSTAHLPPSYRKVKWMVDHMKPKNSRPRAELQSELSSDIVDGHLVSVPSL